LRLDAYMVESYVFVSYVVVSACVNMVEEDLNV
jgi:hypothetical protein